MRLSHAGPHLSAVFDEANLVSCAGLAPVVALGQRCGLAGLVAGTLTLKAKGGRNADLKVPALVAGMVAGADSIDDMDLLRHGAMDRLFTGGRAPSTLGTFLRSFTFGHVRQLDAVAARLLERLARTCPLLPGAVRVTYLDVDDTVREVHGYAKQGVGYGYSGVKGLNALIAAVSTPTCAPLIAATRLRKRVGQLRPRRRPAGRRRAGHRPGGRRRWPGPDRDGLVLLRADSAFFTHDALAAARRGGACFSVTARMNKAVVCAIMQRRVSRHGRRSATPTPSMTKTSADGSATPRSPTWRSPPSPAAAKRTT